MTGSWQDERDRAIDPPAANTQEPAIANRIEDTPPPRGGKGKWRSPKFFDPEYEEAGYWNDYATSPRMNVCHDF